MIKINRLLQHTLYNQKFLTNFRWLKAYFTHASAHRIVEISAPEPPRNFLFLLSDSLYDLIIQALKNS